MTAAYVAFLFYFKGKIEKNLTHKLSIGFAPQFSTRCFISESEISFFFFSYKKLFSFKMQTKPVDKVLVAPGGQKVYCDFLFCQSSPNELTIFIFILPPICLLSGDKKKRFHPFFISFSPVSSSSPFTP